MEGLKFIGKYGIMDKWMNGIMEEWNLNMTKGEDSQGISKGEPEFI